MISSHRILLLPAFLLALAPPPQARALDPLRLPAGGGDVEAVLTPRLDLSLFVFDGTPPALLHAGPGDETVFSPRLTLPLDLFLGDSLYGFAKVRIDDGFDPGAAPDGEIRIDEAFLRYALPGNQVQVQIGKFASSFGAWTRRHESDDDAFLLPPLAYSELTGVVDHLIWTGPAGLLGNRGRPNNVDTWLPVSWGPAYLPGIAVFAEAGDFSAHLELRTRADSARPEEWDAIDFGDPTWGARIGYRPNAAWDFGASVRGGPYHRDLAGPGAGDFDQTTLGLDLSYARGHWQLWAEVVYSEFGIPAVDPDADLVSYFVESRWKLAPQTYTSLRWNQTLYGDLGGFGPWDNDVFRADAVFGHRFSPSLEVRGQYSWTRQDADFQNGEHLLGLQVTARFR